MSVRVRLSLQILSEMIMFEFIGSGCSRSVYAIDDLWVLKVPNDINSIWDTDQCRIELETFIRYGSDLPLCKINLQYSSDTRIVMERVSSMYEHHKYQPRFEKTFNTLVEAIPYNSDKMYTCLEYFEETPAVRDFVQKIRNSRLTSYEMQNILFDITTENCGYDLDGNLVILDYGLLRKTS